MSIRDMDGQMDFLGLITEYTDNQGANIRVREPGAKRLKYSENQGFEQMSMDLEAVSFDAAFKETKESGIKITDVETGHEECRVSESVSNVKVSDGKEIEIEKTKKESVKVEEESERAEKKEPETAKEEPERVEKEPEEKSEKQVTLPEPEKKDIPDIAKEKPQRKKRVEKKTESPIKEPEAVIELPATEKKDVKEILFKQCTRCWCHDCRHNSRNEAVPREICGITMPCPACADCIAEDMATICEINNAREGCRTRALEEGIIEEEEFTEG